MSDKKQKSSSGDEGMNDDLMVEVHSRLAREKHEPVSYFCLFNPACTFNQ